MPLYSKSDTLLTTLKFDNNKKQQNPSKKNPLENPQQLHFNLIQTAEDIISKNTKKQKCFLLYERQTE